MKKFIKFAALVLISGLLFSCQNFLKGGTLLDSLNETIEFNSLPEVKTYVMIDDADSGSTIPVGEQSYKLNQEYTVIYKPASNYELLYWEAAYRTKTEGNAKDSVVFTGDIKANETKFKIVKEDTDLLIRPVVSKQLNYELFPADDGTEYPLDSSITITFNKKISDSNSTDYETDETFAAKSIPQNSIRITGPGNKNYSSYFEKPSFNNNMLVIKANKDKPLKVEKYKNLKITVTIPEYFYFEENSKDLKIRDSFSWTYIVNDKTNYKSEITCSITDNFGNIKPEGTKQYNIGETFEIKFYLNENVVIEDINKWEIKAGNETAPADVLSIKKSDTDDTVYECTINKQISGLTIAPKAYLKPAIVKIEPENLELGIPCDSQIKIYFNKPIDPSTFIYYLYDTDTHKSYMNIYDTTYGGIIDFSRFLDPVFSEDFKTVTLPTRMENNGSFYFTFHSPSAQNIPEFIDCTLLIGDENNDCSGIKDTEEEQHSLNEAYPEGYKPIKIRFNEKLNDSEIRLNDCKICFADSVNITKTGELNNQTISLSLKDEPNFLTVAQKSEHREKMEEPIDISNLVIRTSLLQDDPFEPIPDNGYLYFVIDSVFDKRVNTYVGIETYKADYDDEGYPFFPDENFGGNEKPIVSITDIESEIALDGQLLINDSNIVRYPINKLFKQNSESGIYKIVISIKNQYGTSVNKFVCYLSYINSYKYILDKMNFSYDSLNSNIIIPDGYKNSDGTVTPQFTYKNFYHNYYNFDTWEKISCINDNTSNFSISISKNYGRKYLEISNESSTFKSYINNFFYYQTIFSFTENGNSYIYPIYEKNNILSNEKLLNYFKNYEFRYKTNKTNEISPVIKISSNTAENTNITITPIVIFYNDDPDKAVSIEFNSFDYTYKLANETANSNYQFTLTEQADNDYLKLNITDNNPGINYYYLFTNDDYSKIQDFGNINSNTYINHSNGKIFLIGNNNGELFYSKQDRPVDSNKYDYAPPVLNTQNIKWNALGQMMLEVTDDNLFDNNLQIKKEIKITWKHNTLPPETNSGTISENYTFETFAYLIPDGANTKKGYLIFDRPIKNSEEYFSVELQDLKNNRILYENIYSAIPNYTRFNNSYSYKNGTFNYDENYLQFYNGSFKFVKYSESSNNFDIQNQLSIKLNSFDISQMNTGNFYSAFYEPENNNGPIFAPVFFYHTTEKIIYNYKSFITNEFSSSVDIDEDKKALVIYYSLPMDKLQDDDGEFIQLTDITPTDIINNGIIRNTEVITGRKTLQFPELEREFMCARIVFMDNTVYDSKVYINF